MTAAFELFLEEGYSNVSMVDIIRRSGGSLATAYELFESKTGLLKALIEERSEMFREAVRNAACAAGSPEEALKRAARQYLTKVLESGTLAMLRIVVAESQRDPLFGNYFQMSAPAVSARMLSDAFRRWNDEGLLDVDDPDRAADSFFALLLHKVQMEGLCCMPVSMTEADREDHIDHVVQMICCRYGKGRRQAPTGAEAGETGLDPSGRSGQPRRDSCG